MGLAFVGVACGALRGSHPVLVFEWWPGVEEGDGRTAVLFTVGVEEELILVDAVSLEPVDAAAWALAAVGDRERFKAEFRSVQIELVTPVCATVADVARELSGGAGAAC
jgi:Glutamate-cysteine ligase family 2(GCS2)